MIKFLETTGAVFAGAASGLLTRPCCVFPIVMSALGLSGVVAGGIFARYQGLFTVASIVLLAGSVIVTTTRSGGAAAKVIAIGASVMAFAVSRFWIGAM